jgi:DNA-binding MarR family transcriptional regulator
VGEFQDDTSAEERLLVGLSRIGHVLRSQAWDGVSGKGIHPTQAQVLVAIARSRPPGPRLSELADHLAVTPPTVSESVAALERKGLLERRSDPADGRAIRLNLTRAGREAADELAEWPDLLLETVDDLDPAESGALLLLVTKLIRGLQVRGKIAPQRMCLTCRYFQADVHANLERPHHCGFVDAPFGNRQLRLDCLDHEVAAVP